MKMINNISQNLEVRNNMKKITTSFSQNVFWIWLITLCLLPSAIFHLSAQTLNLNQFGIEEGLPQSSIYTMLQDKDGNIWVGTMSGVSKYNGLSFENFTKKDGLAENRDRK